MWGFLFGAEALRARATGRGFAKGKTQGLWFGEVRMRADACIGEREAQMQTCLHICIEHHRKERSDARHSDEGRRPLSTGIKDGPIITTASTPIHLNYSAKHDYTSSPHHYGLSLPYTMNTIHKLFNIDHIYTRQTWRAALTDVALALLVLIFMLQPLSSVMGSGYDVVLLAIGATISWWAIRKLIIMYTVRNRLRQRSYVPALLLRTPSKFSASSINDMYERYDSFQTIAEATDWQLFDATFDKYRHTKHGDYLAKQTYFTVYEHQLTRELPHVIFDSRRARGRQFKYRYLSSQRLSLEGNFDEYFDTYVPDYYEIDSLAFVSPEVMHILIEASDYDIEITHNRLFLYGPLADNEAVGHQYALGQKLAAAINDNIRHYTDSYMPANTKKTQVTAFGRQLLQSPVRYIASASVAGAACLGLTAVAIKTNSPRVMFNEVSLLVYISLVGSTYKAYMISKDNKLKTSTFLAVKNYVRSHPNRR